MDRSDIIKLISSSWVKDANGVNRKTETSRQVFCNVRSVTQSEFYQAAQMGIKPEYRFIMFKYDYQNEMIIEYNGVRYSVYRTYFAEDDLIELNAQKAAGINGHSNISG